MGFGVFVNAAGGCRRTQVLDQALVQCRTSKVCLMLVVVVVVVVVF